MATHLGDSISTLRLQAATKPRRAAICDDQLFLTGQTLHIGGGEPLN
jgi:hypothetical protein